MHRRYYILIILVYYSISNTYLGCNIADAHRPTIPHVDPLHLHVGPEGVGDPEKALRLDFKALQPLNPPKRGPQRVEPPVLGDSVARRGMILAVGEDGWARGRVLPVRSDHPPVRHSADHAAAGEAGAGAWRCCSGWAPC